MEAQAWVGKCDGCGLYCVLYEQVEFVCDKCHGEIRPGNTIGAAVDAALTTLFEQRLAAVDAALTTLFEQRLPTRDVLRVLWLGSTPHEDTRDDWEEVIA